MEQGVDLSRSTRTLAFLVLDDAAVFIGSHLQKVGLVLQVLWVELAALKVLKHQGPPFLGGGGGKRTSLQGVQENA